MQHQVNPIQILACKVMSLSAIASSTALCAIPIPQTAQAIPQTTFITTVSLTPENITNSLCLWHQQTCTNCARRPPRPDPPGGSR